MVPHYSKYLTLLLYNRQLPKTKRLPNGGWQSYNPLVCGVDSREQRRSPEIAAQVPLHRKAFQYPPQKQNA